MNSEALSRNINQIWKFVIPTLEGEIKTLSKKITALEKKIKEGGSSGNPTISGDIESVLKPYEEAIVLNREAIQTLINRLNELSSTTSQQDSELVSKTNDLESQQSTLIDELNTLQEALNDLSGRLGTLENSNPTAEVNDRINQLSSTVSQLRNTVNSLEYQTNYKLEKLEKLPFPSYAYIMDVSLGYSYEENMFDPENTTVAGCVNDLGSGSDMLRMEDFENIDVNKERRFGYLYIPNEYMLDNTMQFINRVNTFFEEYKSVHGNYPCFRNGLNLLVHTRELSYHANYGPVNGNPDYPVYLRNLMKHVNRICILGQAHGNAPTYTELNNLNFERLNSWNGATVGIPIFNDSAVKTIDFDTSFGWDYIHLTIDVYVDEGQSLNKFSPGIKNIRFPSDAKVIGLRTEFHDHTRESINGSDEVEWEVAENSWIETLDIPAGAWKCDIEIPLNTLKNVYLPTNPTSFRLATNLAYSKFMKANHINFRRSIHNDLEFDYSRYSNTHTICDSIQSSSGTNTESTTNTQDLSETRNVVEFLSSGGYKNYMEVKDLSLDDAGTHKEPGGLSMFHYNVYGDYDSNHYRTLFNRDFYYGGGYYYNILHEKFIYDAANDYSNRYKLKIPFNNRFETLMFDLNNFKETHERKLQFRFAAPSIADKDATVKQNCFKRLVVVNADHLDWINLESRVEPNDGEDAIDSVVDSIPHMINWYSSLIYLNLPPARELKIDMVHPVHLLELDLTKFERTEIQNLYLDEKCVIKVNSYIFTWVRKIYYTTEDKKPKFVSDILTEEELQEHFYNKCELLPFVQ